MADNWVRICAESDLEENWGEVALVDDHQYAIYKTKHGIFASDHLDPTARHSFWPAVLSAKRTVTPPSPPPLQGGLRPDQR